MAFVLDASIAVAWVVPTQATPYTRSLGVRARREPYHVPSIFVAEVTNVLVTLQRRAILSETGAAAAADVLSRFAPIVHPITLNVIDLRRLANRYNLTAYDSTYLALAMELHLPIACGDRPLKAALKSAGVKLA